MSAGETLNNFELTIDAPILAGQKIAKVDIAKNDPIFEIWNNNWICRFKYN